VLRLTRSDLGSEQFPGIWFPRIQPTVIRATTNPFSANPTCQADQHRIGPAISASVQFDSPLQERKAPKSTHRSRTFDHSLNLSLQTLWEFVPFDVSSLIREQVQTNFIILVCGCSVTDDLAWCDGTG
jgi:hypothetical protein